MNIEKSENRTFFDKFVRLLCACVITFFYVMIFIIVYIFDSKKDENEPFQ